MNRGNLKNNSDYDSLTLTATDTAKHAVNNTTNTSNPISNCKLNTEKLGRVDVMDNIQNDNKFATKKKTIIVCEDEPDVLLSFEVMLKSKYNIIMVDSGEECIEKYIEEINRGNKIDLVLLDYKLSDIMGDSVARKIKKCGETKIILISAFNIDGVLVKELENGSYISKYILKPIETDSLVNLIDEIVKE